MIAGRPTRLPQSLALARQIEQRYRRVGVRPRGGMERILRRQAAPLWQQFVDARSSFSPVFRLQPVLREPVIAGMTNTPTAALAQRLSARHERRASVVERRPTAGAAAIQAPASLVTRSAAAAPAAVPVERVVTRTVPTVPPSPPLPQPRHEYTETAAPPPFAPPKNTGTFPLPAPEVNRLASEVLKAIDRRVVAYRERTGRR